MTEAVIVAAARTPIGRSYKGSLVGVDAFTLAETAVSAVIERAGIDGKALDDLVLAESLQGGGAIARHTAVRLGLDNVPGLGRQSPLRCGPIGGRNRSGQYPSGHGPAHGRRRDRKPVDRRPARSSACPVGDDLQPWYSPTHPATEDAPNRDMSITVGREHRPCCRRHARRGRRMGIARRTFGPRPPVTRANSPTRSCQCQLSASTAT